VGRGRVEVKVELLDVLAVIALADGEARAMSGRWERGPGTHLCAGQAIEALLEDRVAAIPQRDGEAQAALAIAEAEQTVFAPAVRTRPRMVVRKVCPAATVRRVVFADLNSQWMSGSTLPQTFVSCRNTTDALAVLC
jgi:hypothetical protein